MANGVCVLGCLVGFVHWQLHREKRGETPLVSMRVLANGEKVPPADMESAITEDALFDQCMLIGERMPYLAALVVLNPELWQTTAAQWNIARNDQDALRDEMVEKKLLQRIQRRTHEFPGYATIRRVAAILEPWPVESGLLTPTLKVKRAKVLEKYSAQVEWLYEGHNVYRNE